MSNPVTRKNVIRFPAGRAAMRRPGGHWNDPDDRGRILLMPLGARRRSGAGFDEVVVFRRVLAERAFRAAKGAGR